MATKVKKRKLQKHFIDRLSKLAEHLEFGELAHKKFDFSVFNGMSDPVTDVLTGANPEFEGCGTAGCALGECPAIFPQWVFRDVGNGWGRTKYSPVLKASSERSIDASARKFFGLRAGEVLHLFYPDRQWNYEYGGKVLKDTATREEVAANLRAFLYTLKTKPWNDE